MKAVPHPAHAASPVPAPAQVLGTRARLAIAGLITLMALLWIVVEEIPALLSPSYSLYQVVWMRYGVHLLFLLLYLAARGKLTLVRTAQPGLQIGRGLLMLAMPFFFISALGYARASAIMAVFWVAPFMVLALAALLQRDFARWATWLATLLGFGAVILILRPDRSGISTLGALLALGMAFSFSLYVVLTRSLRTEATATNLFYTAAAVFVPLSFVMPLLWKMPTLEDVAIMTVVGLAGLGLLWALDRACELGPVSALAPYLLAPPVLAALINPWLTGAMPGRSILLGTGVALVAALLAWWATGHVHISEQSPH